MALRGLKVIEMMGLAPGPFCGMILADFGASVTVVQKIEPMPFDVMSHGKRMISVNLKTQEGIHIIKKMCDCADIILDTFRPGVMEKMGLGPDILLKENPQLIYARLTGYGQSGPYKNRAGHDINYVAMSGVLSFLSKNMEAPVPPLNLLADFGGGGLMCALGILLALYERTKSGKGQIIDASMVDGTAYLASWVYRSQQLPIWSGQPGTNILDGGVAFYGTYKTKDDKFMAVGALEPQFYSQLLEGLQLSSEQFNQFSDPQTCKKKFEEIFVTKTQEEWCKIFDKLDACVTPVLDLNSVAKHPHNVTRNLFHINENTLIPEPSPKLSRTPGRSQSYEPLQPPGQHTREILSELKYSPSNIDQLIQNGIVYAGQQSKLYLASGNSFQSLHYEYLLGAMTIREIVRDTCDKLWVCHNSTFIYEREDIRRLVKNIRGFL